MVGLRLRISDEQLYNWTKPAFGTEETRADQTAEIVRTAIKSHPILSPLNIRVFPKGSYKNNTNVRRESDIDIAVEYRAMMRVEYAPGAEYMDRLLPSYSGTFAATGIQVFKTAVGEALRLAFTPQSVDGSGNRVFRVRASAKTMDADVIPCTTYGFYLPDGSSRRGIELILDKPDGQRHFNYPDQHYDNGVSKNKNTQLRYKNVVRILKNIEDRLVAADSMQSMPSFLIECLAYNVVDTIYTSATTWRDMVRGVCRVINWYTEQPEPDNELYRWREVNGHKFLFHPNQKWLREEANLFGILALQEVSA
jgi:hypothetical protein